METWYSQIVSGRVFPGVGFGQEPAERWSLHEKWSRGKSHAREGSDAGRVWLDPSRSQYTVRPPPPPPTLDLGRITTAVPSRVGY